MQITCTEKKVFEINILEEYHGLNVQSNTLLLADVFENFRNILTKIRELEPACFCLFIQFFSVFVIRLAWQAVSKKPKVNQDLLIDIDKLLMVEKGIGGGM